LDPSLDLAASIVERARRTSRLPVTATFFDPASFTASHVVHDPGTLRAAIIDPVLDLDPASGYIATHSADEIAAYVVANGLTVDWLLETHVHADHLSAALHLRGQLGGQLGIGREITAVQKTFGEVGDTGAASRPDRAAFDRLFDDGDSFRIGEVEVAVLHLPGHTPADVAYVVGDCVFCGDTIFMPDYGTARADFPGGDARQLFRSIRRLLELPEDTRLLLCHDYRSPGRDDFVWETTVGEQRRSNVHVSDTVEEEDFVAMREARDRTLPMPRLMHPAIRVNMHGGRLPPADASGRHYLIIEER